MMCASPLPDLDCMLTLAGLAAGFLAPYIHSQTQSHVMLYRVDQLNLTPEIEVFYMLFDRSLSISSMTSLKLHMKYFHFRCYIQLGLPVIRVSGRAIHTIPHIYSTKFLHTFHMIKSQS